MNTETHTCTVTRETVELTEEDLESIVTLHVKDKKLINPNGRIDVTFTGGDQRSVHCIVTSTVEEYK